jgi:methionyl-tRNA synthetase
MIERYRDGQIAPSDGDDPLGDVAGAVCARLDRIDVTGALEEIWQRIRSLNQFVAAEEPWKLAKDPERAADLDAVLYRLAEGLRVLSILLHPWIPDSADKLLDAIGEERRTLDAARFGDWPGAKVSKIEPLFPRIDD